MALAVYPPSTGFTRSGAVGLLVLIYFRIGGPDVVAACCSMDFARFCPSDAVDFWCFRAVDKLTPEPLREEYIASLRRYTGKKYVWGGEGMLGVDCSGLIRRGMIDALFCRGVRTLRFRVGATIDILVMVARLQRRCLGRSNTAG